MKHLSVSNTTRHGRTLNAVRAISAGGVLVLLGALTGCANQALPSTSALNGGGTQTHRITGHIHGGQQPVAGAVIQLYGATIGSYGAQSSSLLTTTVTSSDGTGVNNSNANSGNNNNQLPLGDFNITGDYTCPSSNLVYITATTGNPGSGANANLALMAALGSCSYLQANANTITINIDEVTTVASVYALQRFMSSYTNVGAPSTNSTGLANAFATVNSLVNTSLGTALTTTPSGNGTVPTAEINTLADALATCINSTGGLAGSSTPCGNLFTYAMPTNGTAPTDTIGAILDIALNPSPSTNTLNICELASSSAPFQPTLGCTGMTSPPNFLMAINYTGAGLNAPNAIAIDNSSNIWLTNGGTSSVSELSNLGTALSGSGGYTTGGISGPSGIAVDLTGNIWVSNKTGNSVTELSSGGSAVGASPFTGSGVSSPSGIAIDGLGNVWLSNSGNSSVSEFSSTGVYTANYTPDAGLSSPTGIAINAH